MSTQQQSNTPSLETPYDLHHSTTLTQTDGYTIHALDWKKQPCCSRKHLQYPVYTFKSPPPQHVDSQLWQDFQTEANTLLHKSFRTFVVLQLLCYLPFVLDMVLAVYLFLRSGESPKSAHHFWHALFMLILGYTICEFLKERLMKSNVHPKFLRLVTDWEPKFEEKGIILQYIIDSRSQFQLFGIKPTESYLRFQPV